MKNWPKKNFQKSNLGFTLLETLLVISLFAILAGTSIPVYYSFQMRNELTTTTNNISQSLKRAQTLSQAVDGDSSWSVHIQLGKLTIFKGSDYNSRDFQNDEDFDIPTSITPSGLSDIVFQKFTGEPTNTGTITLSSKINEQRTLTINSKGMITY